MSEDRTQEPSMRRRLLARERGQVARSPELTGAAALLAASGLLWVWGDSLGVGLIATVRAPWVGDLGVPPAGAPPLDLVARLGGSLGAVMVPVLGILGGSLTAAILAHQAQVGGLFNPGQLAPDFSRLWHLSLDEEGGEGFAARAGRGGWSLLKALVVVAVASLVIQTHLTDFYRLSHADAPSLARAAGGLIRSTALTLAVATAVLGLVDYALQRRRFEAMLRMTSDEYREDLRSADGDPALRARRRHLAKSLRGDAPELLKGASLTITGPSDLAIVLAGGPPPRKVSIRSSAHGPAGQKLRQSAAALNLPAVEFPPLALALAHLRTPAIPSELLPMLRDAWPDLEAVDNQGSSRHSDLNPPT